jgi:hypothetical protein
MAYSDFTLSQLETEFNLTLQERVDIFKEVEPVVPSPLF